MPGAAQSSGSAATESEGRTQSDGREDGLGTAEENSNTKKFLKHDSAAEVRFHEYGTRNLDRALTLSRTSAPKMQRAAQPIWNIQRGLVGWRNARG